MSRVSEKTLSRLPFYLKAAESLKESGNEYVSASDLASLLSLNEEQVKKDLQVVSSTSGKPRKGREINTLIRDIQDYLGYKNNTDAVVVGAGHLGQALLNYKGFSELGINIQAAFDIDKKIVGQAINGKPVFHVGIKAIWNFSPIHLNVPNDVIVEYVNLASSLAVISAKLKEN